MSTLHNTGGRIWAWVRAHRLAILATGAVLVFMAVTFAATFRAYDNRLELEAERQFRLDAVAEQAAMNRMINRDLCEGLNAATAYDRQLLDTSIRLRGSRPQSDEERAAVIDLYRLLPERNCDTGAKTYFDPPFPSSQP